MNRERREGYEQGETDHRNFAGFAQPRVVGWEGERKPPVAQGFRAGWARRDPFGQKLSESGGENEKNEAADVVVPRSGAEDEACF